MEGDNKHNVKPRNIYPCQGLKTSLNHIADAKCKLTCAIAEMKSAAEKGECLVDLTKSLTVTSIEELQRDVEKLVMEYFTLIKEHAMQHPAHGGRQATDSGYCNSSDIATMTSEQNENVGLAERQDYPSNPDDHQPNSLPDLQSLHLNNGDTLHRSISHC